jgi:dTDP-4-amino-4,6-dideoxygalactose transaminase
MCFNMNIPFNRVYLTGREEVYLKQVLESGFLSGNGPFSKMCARYFEENLGIHKAFLTTSCTDALEMCALLLNIKQGDEVILPSYTFVSTANAFILRGAKLVFADSSPSHPNIDLDHVERLLTPQTKAVVVVHYGGVACDLDRLAEMLEGRDTKIVEDAAHSVDAYYKGRHLGTIGHLATFSFHQTKNIVAGEGGLLAINDAAFAERAEILWEKGTNRSQFFRGECDRYGWIDLGSSFLASELVAAVLWAQLEGLTHIQDSRRDTWSRYQEAFQPYSENGLVKIPTIPAYATNNAHLYSLVCPSGGDRDALLEHLRARGVQATFHYQPLHSSAFFSRFYEGEDLIHAIRYSDCLLRLPLLAGMAEKEVETVIDAVVEHFDSRLVSPLRNSARQ